ncbi:MAG: hypothetical protein ACNS63_11600 [Candidatus Nitrospinota bacterium M3_3B_026]
MVIRNKGSSATTNMLKKGNSPHRLLLMWMMIYSSVLVGSGGMEGAVICFENGGAVALETARNGLCERPAPSESYSSTADHPGHGPCLDIPVFISPSGLFPSSSRPERQLADTERLSGAAPSARAIEQPAARRTVPPAPAKPVRQFPESLRSVVLLI